MPVNRVRDHNRLPGWKSRWMNVGRYSGSAPVHRNGAHGTKLSLTTYRHSLDDVTRCLGHAGSSVTGWCVS